MFRNNKWLGGFAAVLLGALFLVSQGVYAGQEEPDREKTENTKTITAERSDYTEYSVLKDVKWIFQRHDSLMVAEEEATLVEYLVQNNQEVKKGEPLLSYEVPVDSILLEETRISLKRKESAYLKQVKQKEDYIKELRDQLQYMDLGMMDAQILALNIDKLEIELEQFEMQSKQDLKNTGTSMKELEDRMEIQYLEAPYDGVVIMNENYKKGARIDAYRELLHIYDIKSAILGTEITGVNKFWYGMEVSITGVSNMKEDKSKIYKGKVISVDTLYNGKLNTGMIYIQPENPELLSLIQRANLTALSVVVKDVIVIPKNAVRYAGDVSYVYLLDNQGEIRRQYVSGRENGRDMWVFSGLSEGQRIVLE